MKVAVVLPVKGKSRRYPGKNELELAGESLIHRTIRVAREYPLTHSVFVSSDSSRILVHGHEAGAIPIIRPSELAEDHVRTWPVLRHALKEIEEHHFQPDVVVWLQVGSPFRTVDHIADTVRAVMKDQTSGWAKTFHDIGPVHDFYRLNADDHTMEELGLVPTDGTAGERAYESDGVVVAVRPWALKEYEEEPTGGVEPAVPVLIDPKYTLDIDTEYDYQQAVRMVGMGVLV
jgi:CMP-N-acetylneuraminic acid synthetase